MIGVRYLWLRQWSLSLHHHHNNNLIQIDLVHAVTVTVTSVNSKTQRFHYYHHITKKSVFYCQQISWSISTVQYFLILKYNEHRLIYMSYEYEAMFVVWCKLACVVSMKVI